MKQLGKALLGVCRPGEGFRSSPKEGDLVGSEKERSGGKRDPSHNGNM